MKPITVPSKPSRGAICAIVASRFSFSSSRGTSARPASSRASRTRSRPWSRLSTAVLTSRAPGWMGASQVPPERAKSLSPGQAQRRPGSQTQNDPLSFFQGGGLGGLALGWYKVALSGRRAKRTEGESHLYDLERRQPSALGLTMIERRRKPPELI